MINIASNFIVAFYFYLSGDQIQDRFYLLSGFRLDFSDIALPQSVDLGDRYGIKKQNAIALRERYCFQYR